MKRFSWNYLPVFLVLFALVFPGCAAGDPTRWNAANPAGFWAGLWHGIISVITFIISLFSKNVKMYECFNNGGWYDFGFLLGVILVLGGGGGVTSNASRRGRVRRRD